MKIVKVFFGWVFEVKIAEKKCFLGRGLCLTHVGAPCCETWLKKRKVKFEFIVKKNVLQVTKKSFGCGLPR
jgi:hypothetical protein